MFEHLPRRLKIPFPCTNVVLWNSQETHSEANLRILIIRIKIQAACPSKT